MSDDEVVPREQLHRVIQATNSTDSDLEDAILVSWVLVCEWSDPEGERWIAKLSGSAGGAEDTPTWQEQGLLHNALFSPEGFK